MPRCAAFCPDSLARRWVGVAGVAACLAFGVVSERIAFGWDRPGAWVPDLAVGLAFLAGGCWAWPAQRGTGVLLVLTALAWYLGNVHAVALYWHRGPLVHLLLTFPTWRPRSRLAGCGVVVGYLAAATSLWHSEIATVALSLALTAVLLRQRLTVAGRARHHRTAALCVGAALAGSLVLGAAARLVAGTVAVDPALWLYDGVLCGGAVGLVVATRRSPASVVTDLVVDLGEANGHTVRDALAAALGDPTLQIAYWQPGTGSYVDHTGVPVAVDGADERFAHIVGRDGEPFAVLVHDPAVLADPSLAAAVAAAARLSAANVALHAELRVRAGQIAASRRRLLVAADDERRRLEERLHDGPQRRLAGIHAALGAGVVPDGHGHVRRALSQIAYTMGEVDALARGLHPRELTGGLSVALRALADRAALPVRLRVPDTALPVPIESAVYFLCAEGLANVAKHARAAGASIDVVRDDTHLTVIVADGGVGGADLSGGGGLRGLADRVEAIGGTLTLESAAGAGTVLTATIPLVWSD